MLKVLIVAGAHPNFMKIAPILHAVEKIPKKVRWTPKLLQVEAIFKVTDSGRVFSLG